MTEQLSQRHIPFKETYFPDYLSRLSEKTKNKSEAFALSGYCRAPLVHITTLGTDRAVQRDVPNTDVQPLGSVLKSATD